MSGQIMGNVRRAMDRSAAVVHEQMKDGVSSLATIATIAPLVGVFGTVIGIVNSFVGISGERSTDMAAVTAHLSDSVVPTALGLLVAMLSFCYYKYLTGRLASIDRDMENACLELQNHLSLLPARSLACTTSAPGNDVIFHDYLGGELREEHRPWYRSTVFAGVLLILAWFMQAARYFEIDELSLPSVAWRAGAYVIFILAFSFIAAYPVWVKICHRKSGAWAVLASALCLSWCVAQPFLPLLLNQ
ncbi:MAG: MotA/TolQ/ExbB proton channel family protein [Bryobacteraceae bacterium]